jgi:hypothetical protein
MTPQQLKTIIRELLKLNGDKLPICAFQMRSGPIYTGEWELLGSSAQTIVLRLADRHEATPPVYIDVIAIDAIAVHASVELMSQVVDKPVPLAKAAAKHTRPTSSRGGGNNG